MSESIPHADGEVTTSQHTPQLYQVIGAVLRDVAQARFMSDIYSRQISYTYEADPVLRQFPVPRVEIEQVEFDLRLAVMDVRRDEKRQQSRNAAISRILDTYSASIMRAMVMNIRTCLRDKAHDAEDQEALASFEKKFVSEDRLSLLRGRLLRYLDENLPGLMAAAHSGEQDAFMVQVAAIEREVHEEFIAFGETPDLAQLIADLDINWEEVWNQAILGSTDTAAGNHATSSHLRSLVWALRSELAAAMQRYPDFSVHVEVSAGALHDIRDALISNVKVTAAVKNYRWTKVDMDEKDMRNIRRLSPE